MTDLMVKTPYGEETLKDIGFIGLQAIEAFDEEDAGKYYLILTNNKWSMRTIKKSYGVVDENISEELLEEDMLAYSLGLMNEDCDKSEINYGIALMLEEKGENYFINLGMDSDYGKTLTEAIEKISKEYNIAQENIFIAEEK